MVFAGERIHLVGKKSRPYKTWNSFDSIALLSSKVDVFYLTENILMDNKYENYPTRRCTGRRSRSGKS